MKKLKFGNPLGSFKNKFNRAAKLFYMLPELEHKLDGIISRGKNSISLDYRCAVAVKLLIETGIRAGNEGSAEGYVSKRKDIMGQVCKTYGLTTLTKEHVLQQNKKYFLAFTGKRLIEQSCYLNGTTKDVLPLLKTEGDLLFNISHYELTKFVHRYVGRKFSPKDFRTMKANLCAIEKIQMIRGRELPQNKTGANAEIKEICAYVSEYLGNTATVCKRSYIDDGLLDEVINERWFNA